MIICVKAAVLHLQQSQSIPPVYPDTPHRGLFRTTRRRRAAAKPLLILSLDDTPASSDMTALLSAWYFVAMAKPPHILLLTDDNLRREKWRQMLPDPAEISPDPGTLHSATLDVPDLIITDHLPITAPLGLAATPLACGEIAVVAVGAAGLADVVLPADCTPRELRLGLPSVSGSGQVAATTGGRNPHAKGAADHGVS